MSVLSGCPSGVYGNNCDAPCPTNCGERFCHTQNGTCFSCNPGTYGRNCEVTCPKNCKEQFCKMLDGSCLTCKPGWTGLFCNTSMQIVNFELWYFTNCIRIFLFCKIILLIGLTIYVVCMEGWYGQNCKSECAGQCQENDTCNHVTGWCGVGCAVGWTGLFCNIEKSTVQSVMFGCILYKVPLKNIAFKQILQLLAQAQARHLRRVSREI